MRSNQVRGRTSGRRAAVPPFQAFLDQHRQVVYRFLVAQVGPVEADDLFQETFLAALRAYPRLRDGANLKGWVLTIATRKAIDAGRAAARRPVAMPDVEAVADGRPGHVAIGPSVGDARDPLWVAVRGLPPKQRAAVVHRVVLDRSYADVAAAMGTTEDSARQNVRMGLRRLREDVIES
jgi:RNA polymerase sigma factor (sigma-70 family)